MSARAEGGEHDFWGRHETRRFRPVRVEEHAGRVVMRSPEGNPFGRPVIAGDVDGDGWDDIAVVSFVVQMCGFAGPIGDLRILSGRTLEVLGQNEGGYRYTFDATSGSDWLVSRCARSGESTVELRSGMQREYRWRRCDPNSPFRGISAASFVGDVDADGFEDVGIGSFAAGVRWPGKQDWICLGAAAVLSGRDGTMIWGRWGTSDLSGYGFDLAPLGDHDCDGTPDVAVLADSMREGSRSACVFVHDGRTGRPLLDIPLPADLWPESDEVSWEGWRMRAVGDLDGDGLQELLFWYGYQRLGLVVLSTRTRELLDVSGGWELSWAAAGGDLDGDGVDDLVLGRVDPEGGERRISLYSSSGLRDLLTIYDMPEWRGATATVDGEGPGLPWRLLLEIDGEARLFSDTNEIHVLQMDPIR